jgi:hypothetical protein
MIVCENRVPPWRDLSALGIVAKEQMKSKNRQVAEKIIEILQGGLTLNADTQHYIDSTFSNPSAGEFAELLQDQSSCETDSLMELLFFPDESVQLQLEEMIAETHFQSRDEAEIKNQVCSTSLQTSIRFGDGRGTIEKRVTPTNAAKFIARLNLSRYLDPGIRSAILRYVPRELQTRCKVRLRNARPITSPNKISFLQTFFKKLQIDNDVFFEHLDFTLSFLDEIKDEADIFPSLMARKKRYIRSLQKAKKLDNKLSRHNVETLLLRGERVSCIDKADARKKIQIIDRISLAVFGKTEFFDMMPAGAQCITLEGKDDINKLIQKLS